MQSTPDPADLVVLLDDDATPVGTAPRATVHGRDTPLHLAYSVHLLDDDGRVLVTRRALSKRTWPGVWTNSFCGHPRPGESLLDAVHRGAAHELGIAPGGLRDVAELIPDFRYRAVDAAGIVENEVCPVFVARTSVPVRPADDEVAEYRWIPVDDLVVAVERAPWALSPWLVQHGRALDDLDARRA